MAEADTSSRFPRVGRWVLYIAGGLLAFVLLIAALLPWLYPPERLKAFVVPRMEEAIGREVEIDRIRMRVLPYPTVRVSDFNVANAEGFGPEPAIEGRALNVDVALWPLFTGTIHPTAVELVDPIIRYQVAEDGATNLDDLIETEDTTEAEEPLQIGVDEFRASGARVVYDDREAGQTMILTFGTRLNVTPDPEQGAVESTGTVDVDTVQVVQAETPSDTLALEDIWVSYDVRMEQAEGRAEIRQLSVETLPLSLTATGRLTGLDTTPAVDLEFETGGSDLSELAAVVPDTTMEAIEPRGTVQLEGRIQGPLSDTTGEASLSIEGQGELTDVGVDYRGTTMLDGVDAELVLARDSMAVQSIEGQLLGNPLSGQIAIHDLTEEPTYGGHLEGAADLGRLSSLTAEDGGEPQEIGGTAAFDVDFQGPVAAPSDVRLEGPIRLSDVRYGTPSLRAPLQIGETTIQLTGTGLSADEVPMQSGENQMALAFEVEDLFPLSEGLAETDPAARVSFTFTSDQIDLVQLYPEETEEVTYSQLMSAHLSGTTIDGQSPEAVAEERYGGTELPQITANGRVEIATLLNPPQRFDDVAFDVQLQDRRLELQNLTAQAYEGQVEGRIAIDQSQANESASLQTEREGSLLMASASPAVAPQEASSTPPTTLTYDLQVQNAEASAFLQDWTQLGSAVTGTLEFSASGRSSLTDGLLPVTEALEAEGRSVVTDGGFDQTFGLPEAVIQRLGITPPSLRDFEQFGGPFTIESGQFVVDEWSLATNQLQTTVSGRLGLGGAVDLALQMDLPLSLVEDSNLPGLAGGEMDALFERLGGEDQTLQLEVGLVGTVQNPEVQLDDEAVQEQFRQLAREAGRGLVQSLFDSGGGN